MKGTKMRLVRKTHPMKTNKTKNVNTKAKTYVGI